MKEAEGKFRKRQMRTVKNSLTGTLHDHPRHQEFKENQPSLLVSIALFIRGPIGENTLPIPHNSWQRLPTSALCILYNISSKSGEIFRKRWRVLGMDLSWVLFKGLEMLYLWGPDYKPMKTC